MPRSKAHRGGNGEPPPVKCRQEGALLGHAAIKRRPVFVRAERDVRIVGIGTAANVALGGRQHPDDDVGDA